MSRAVADQVVLVCDGGIVHVPQVTGWYNKRRWPSLILGGP